MKTKAINLALALFMGLFAFSPLLKFSLAVPEAQAVTCTGSVNGSPLVADPSTGLCLPAPAAGQPQNAQDLIIRGINILLSIAFLVAVLFLVIGGFRYVVSGGNAEQAESGRKTVTNALIGISIIILAYAIVFAVAKLVTTGRPV